MGWWADPRMISAGPATPLQHEHLWLLAANCAPCAFLLHPYRVKSQSSHFLLDHVWPQDLYARETWKFSFYFQYGFSADFILAHHSVHHIQTHSWYMVIDYFVLSWLIVFGNKYGTKCDIIQISTKPRSVKSLRAISIDSSLVFAFISILPLG